MTLFAGLRSGLRTRLRSGLNPTDGPGDGPNGTVLSPMTDVDFADATGRTPVHAYTCQESSGNLVDQIGAMTLVANGTPLYGQAVSGWSRVGVGFNQTANQRFSAAAGSGPDPTATAVAFLAYVTMRTVAAMRGFLLLSDAGATARSAALYGAAGTLRTQCGAVNNDGTIDHRDAAVHPVLLTYDAAGSTTNRYSDLEKDLGTFAAGVIDGVKGIGAVAGQASHVGEVLALWIFSGADAQFTDAQAKQMLTDLGWPGIPWS